ncbi:MAG: DUF4064 domain-containing protein [Bacteroidales bacterium]|nr:DUF4064 domain-containing protein [Bacteroidales bacterium]
MEENKNKEAWRLLDEASKINEPATKAETDHLEKLLTQAREAADDPHEESFAHKHEDLTDVVTWSNGRHKTWSWAIIGGALLGVLLLWWLTSSKNSDVDKEKQKLQKVEAWTQPCDTVITYESCGEVVTRLGMYDTPNKYKAYKLAYAKERVEDLKANIGKADSMEYYAANKAENEKTLKEWEPKFDEINNMSYEKLKEAAVKDAKSDIKGVKSGANFILALLIIVLVLIPLYIWTGYQRGYEITASRTREKILSWVRKIGFSVAGIFFGAGLVFKFFPDETPRERSQRKGFSNDTGKTGTNLLFKGLLMLVGAIILAFVSIFIMLVETIAGLKIRLRDSAQQRKQLTTA